MSAQVKREAAYQAFVGHKSEASSRWAQMLANEGTGLTVILSTLFKTYYK